MDGQQRTNAELTQIFKLGAVMRDGRFVHLAAGGHDTRPLYAQPGDRQMQARHQRAVLAPAVPVVVGHRRVGAILDPALMVPVVPAAADLAALDLRRSGADAEQKSLREL